MRFADMRGAYLTYMFENIVGHLQVRALLSSAYAGGALAPVLHFSGAAHTGKLTIALELARVLNCRESGDAGCQCDSCAHCAVAEHPAVALIGRRYFVEEIAVYLRQFRADPTGERLRQLARAMNIFIRRFDQNFLDIGDVVRRAEIIPVVRRLQELTSQMARVLRAGDDADSMISYLQDVDKDILDINQAYPGNVSVSSLRLLSGWAHSNSIGTDVRRKCIIIEGSDSLSTRSCNLLLKLLEEPPPRVTIMLLSANSNALPLTVRSRAQEYLLQSRVPAEERRVMGEHIGFIEVTSEEMPGSLHALFFQGDMAHKKAEELAVSLLGALGDAGEMLRRANACTEYITEKLSSGKRESSQRSDNFLYALSDVGYRAWREDPTPQRTQFCSELQKLLVTIHYRHRQLNIPVGDQLVLLLSGISRLHAGLS